MRNLFAKLAEMHLVQGWALAALLSGKVKVAKGATVVCILSGGNIDAERLKALL